MDRLESIKKNLPTTADLPLDSSYEFCWKIRDDLAYVLQRLEGYEKALNQLTTAERDHTLLSVERIAKEALKQP